MRYGSLNSIKQKGHDSPARRGIYAFPYLLFEYFFLSGSYMQPWMKYAKYRYTRDPEGNLITEEHPLYSSYIGYDEHYNPIRNKYFPIKHPKLGKDVCCSYIKPTIFSHTGQIWCHLNSICAYKECDYGLGWWLVDYDEYFNLIKKCIHEQIKGSKQSMRDWGGDPSHIDPREVNWWKFYSMDHFEVFIERVKEK